MYVDKHKQDGGLHGSGSKSMLISTNRIAEFARDGMEVAVSVCC